MSTTPAESLQRLSVEDLRLLSRFLAQHLTPRGSYVTTIARFSQITSDGSGNGTDSLVGPVAGTYWKVQRISKHCSAGTPSLGVFVGPFKNTDPSNRRDFSAAVNADEIADETNPLYVGPGEWLTFQWAGATASTAVLVAACQIEVHKLGEPSLP